MTRRGVVLIVGVVIVAVFAIVLFVVDPFQWFSEAAAAPVYTIAIDAGHGGRDPGAVADDVQEKDINLEIVNILRELIDEQPDMQAFQVRTLDMFIELEDRIARAEEAGADLYLTVHVNSYSDGGPEGVETIVDSTREAGDDSWILAELIQDGVVNATGARDRGTRSQESYLQRTEMPAAYIETGFITNDAERAKLIDPAYQQLIAEGILAGIRQFIDYKYPPPVE